MNDAPFEYLYEPSEIPNARTLLLLHGIGGDEKDLLPVTSYFGSEFNILSLRGNVIENGMPCFFKRLETGVFDEKDLEFRSCKMVAFIKILAVKHDFDCTRIIAIGFADGANIAGSILILSPDFFEGAILFRPKKPFKNKGPLPDKFGTRIFISTGKNDETIKSEDTAIYLSFLENAGFKVTHHYLDAGHNLIKEDLDLAVEWYKQLDY